LNGTPGASWLVVVQATPDLSSSSFFAAWTADSCSSILIHRVVVG
jgi:hypothetical protein